MYTPSHRKAFDTASREKVLACRLLFKIYYMVTLCVIYCVILCCNTICNIVSQQQQRAVSSQVTGYRNKRTKHTMHKLYTRNKTLIVYLCVMCVI